MVVKMVVRPIAKLSETLIRSRLVHRRGLSDAPSMTPYSYRSARSPRQRRVNALGQGQNGSCLDLRTGQAPVGPRNRHRWLLGRDPSSDALANESLAALDPPTGPASQPRGRRFKSSPRYNETPSRGQVLVNSDQALISSLAIR
jgi:hypothetical protein